MDSLSLQRNNICRTCLNEGANFKSLSSKTNGDDRTLSEILCFVTSIDISISDEYPKQVCNECHNMIYKADEFKKRCIQSESLLKSGILTSSFDDLIKNEIIVTTNIPIENMHHSSYNFIKKNSESVQNEIPLFDNIDNLNSDNFKYNVKLESDDEHIAGDLHTIEEAENEQNDNSKEENVCICGYLSVDMCDYESHTSECKLFVKYYEKHIELSCPICKKCLSNINTLENHIKNHKENSLQSNLLCPMCEHKFETKSLLITHLKTHRNKTRAKHKKVKSDYKGFFIPLICVQCDEQFTDIDLLSLHMKTHAGDKEEEVKVEEKRKYQCSLCMRQFAKKSSLIRHVKRHESRAAEKLTCNMCKREFQYKTHLDNHITIAHSKENGLTCGKCGKKFSTQECLDHHMEGHKFNRKHQCKVCGKNFLVPSTLKEHMRTHTGERPYLCSICGRGFSQKNNLTQHMRRHQGLKPFKCEMCDRGFVSKGELEAHSRKHSGAHPFVCDECGNGFTTSSSLTKHRRIHNGQRPYACDLCPKRFAVLGTLKNHRRTHTGEKPFQCSHCEKAFIQRSDLVSHIRCHTGERPYVCTNCGQAFRMAAALKVHLKIHGKEPMLM